MHLVLRHEEWLVLEGCPFLSEILDQSDPFKKRQFPVCIRSYCSFSAVIPSEKSSIILIGSPLRAFQ